MRLLFIISCLGLSISACGKKGKLVQPGPADAYPKSYPSFPKNFEPVQQQDNKNDKKETTASDWGLEHWGLEKTQALQNN